jgi:hypothetical protein
MIHAYAVDPRVAAGWTRREELRYFRDKFGLGTPRVMLELPRFKSWKRAVYQAASSLERSDLDNSRLEEIFKLLGECLCRREGARYDGTIPWLDNAEAEFERRSFAAILAASNPRSHPAVLLAEELGGAAENPLWNRAVGQTVSRTAVAVAGALDGLLINCRHMHFVDPHFDPSASRYCNVIEALLGKASTDEPRLERAMLHCLENERKPALEQFEISARKLAQRIPAGVVLEFRRWRERDGGERFHNRYLLTDLGGVQFPGGLDEGATGETDDLHLLSREQYQHRWAQFVDGNGAFELADEPEAARGLRDS